MFAPRETNQVDELLALSPAERRAALKAMSAEQRRGLWFQTKSAEVAARRAANGTPSNGEPVRVDPGQARAQQWTSNRAVGTIAYDSGFPATGFGNDTGAPFTLLGNHFNTHTGIPVFASGTVSTIQALVVPGPSATTSSAGFVMYGPQTTMGGAPAIFSTFGTATGVIDTVSFSGLGASYTGSEFYVLFGDFATSYIPVFGTGTTLGQGHHAVQGLNATPDITATTPMPGLNGLIRATGNIVPVELMSFDVE